MSVNYRTTKDLRLCDEFLCEHHTQAYLDLSDSTNVRDAEQTMRLKDELLQHGFEKLGTLTTKDRLITEEAEKLSEKLDKKIVFVAVREIANEAIVWEIAINDKMSMRTAMSKRQLLRAMQICNVLLDHAKGTTKSSGGDYAC